jgi:hypothetical protein
MAFTEEWEAWFSAKIRKSGFRWQDERHDYTQFSGYDLFCEQLMREAERRWRLKYDSPPSYSLLMKAMTNAQYAIDKRPWDPALTRWSKLQRWLKRRTRKLFMPS